MAIYWTHMSLVSTSSEDAIQSRQVGGGWCGPIDRMQMTPSEACGCPKTQAYVNHIHYSAMCAQPPSLRA